MCYVMVKQYEGERVRFCKTIRMVVEPRSQYSPESVYHPLSREDKHDGDLAPVEILPHGKGKIDSIWLQRDRFKRRTRGRSQLKRREEFLPK